MKFKDKYPYYRIGEFAKNLGVTPDLLKHYEAIGLIQSEADENGYRYFPFHASSLLLACMGLKNFGLSLKNIRSLLQNQSVEEAIEQIASHAVQMENELSFRQQMLEENRAHTDMVK